MGNCCSDIFKLLFEKYGQEFVTLCVCEKGTIAVKDEFTKARAQLQTLFGDVTKHVNTIVSTNEGKLTKVFEDQKNKAPSGTLQMLEKSSGKTLEQLTGFNSLKGELNTVRKDTLSKMDVEKQRVEAEMTHVENTMLSDIAKKRPSLPLYEELPQGVKNDVLNKAETEFATQIQANRTQIIDNIKKQFSGNTLQRNFGQFNPQRQVDGITGGASSKFSAILSGGNPLGGGGIGSYF